MKKINKYLYLIPALIFISTLPYKFTGNGLPYLYDFFNSITGDWGNYVMVGIGLQELVITAGLVSNQFRKPAAFGAILTMLGAISTHVWLGQYDIVFVEAWVVLITSIIIFNKS